MSSVGSRLWFCDGCDHMKTSEPAARELLPAGDVELWLCAGCMEDDNE